MEKIIIYVIVIAIGILFEYIKKKSRNETASTPVKKAPKQQAYNPFLQFIDTTDDNQKPAPAHVTIPAPANDKTQSATSHKPKTHPQTKHNTDKSSMPFLPGEQEISLSNPIDETPIEVSSPKVPADVAAHYARWRQAILDAEILQRKF